VTFEECDQPHLSWLCGTHISIRLQAACRVEVAEPAWRELSLQPLPARRMTNRNHMGFSESSHEAVLQHVSTPEALGQFVVVARQAQQQGHAPVRARCIPDLLLPSVRTACAPQPYSPFLSVRGVATTPHIVACLSETRKTGVSFGRLRYSVGH
jgi:hypothetical protein